MAYFHLDLGEKHGSNAGVKNESSGSITTLAKTLGEKASFELSLPMCVTCSTQTTLVSSEVLHAGEEEDTEVKCSICLDPRQYIGVQGQKWTTLQRLVEHPKGYENSIDELIPGRLWTLRTEPAFGIGQRAFLLRDDSIDGLVMWDCLALLNDDTLNRIKELSDGKGIAHMIISHPHYYSTSATWAAAFPSMQLWLAKADFEDWYVRRDVVEDCSLSRQDRKGVSRQIYLVEDEQTILAPHLKIILLGGHFPGSLVLLWNDILLIADTIQVVPSGLYHSNEPQRPGVASVTFLWSYPNQIPLSGAEITKVCAPLEKLEFAKAFGAFDGFNIWGHAKDKILQSRDIFLRRLSA